MNPFGALKEIASRFARDERGTFATIFGVTALAGVLSIGVAVDYTRLARTKTVVNDILDTAILAAGNEMAKGVTSPDRLREAFNNQFEANLSLRGVQPGDVAVTGFLADAATGKISASVETNVQMAFMALAGRESVTVDSFAEATFNSSAVEIAMMLDVTGSMDSNGKLDALKLAARDAIDILIPDESANHSVRIGLVPYAASVNGGNYVRRASGTGRVCATERHANPHTDASWRTSPVATDPLGTRGCPNARLQPLTGEATMLKNQIGAFSANGYTAGHLGIAWSYYMLSEKWQSLWTGNEPSDYDGRTRKIAILMTDGEFNTFYRGVGRDQQGGQANRSNAEAIALCTDMKRMKRGNPGITIYAIAFDAPPAAKTTLRACASDIPGQTHFFDAADAADLRNAFRSIATNIRKIHLSR